MTTPAPRPINPYRLTLGVLALAALILGPILVVANQAHETVLGLYEEGSPVGRLAGVLLLIAGTVLGAAWLAVAALQWTPGAPRPASRSSDHGAATLDR